MAEALERVHRHAACRAHHIDGEVAAEGLTVKPPEDAATRQRQTQAEEMAERRKLLAEIGERVADFLKAGR